MQTSKRKIPDPLKALIAFIMFAVCVCAVTAVLSIPYQHTFERDFDTVIIGGSESGWGISCWMINGDERNSVNLAAAPSSMQGRRAALTAALGKYDVDTVILEVSCDALTYVFDEWGIIGKGMIVPKLVTLNSKLNYCVNDAKVLWHEYESVYGYYMAEVYKAWEAIFKNTYEDYYSRAGTDYVFAADVRFAPEEAASLYDSEPLNCYYSDDSINELKNCIEMCLERDIRVVVVTMPVSEEMLWRKSGMDNFRNQILEILKEYDLEYYDFNLMKERQEYFTDAESYRDSEHLSWIGCSAFSVMFKERVLDKNPGSTDIEFYETYEEARQHSYYMTYMNN